MFTPLVTLHILLTKQIIMLFALVVNTQDTEDSSLVSFFKASKEQAVSHFDSKSKEMKENGSAYEMMLVDEDELTQANLDKDESTGEFFFDSTIIYTRYVNSVFELDEVDHMIHR